LAQILQRESGWTASHLCGQSKKNGWTVDPVRVEQQWSGFHNIVTHTFASPSKKNQSGAGDKRFEGDEPMK
jgi:hypothetical protein